MGAKRPIVETRPLARRLSRKRVSVFVYVVYLKRISRMHSVKINKTDVIQFKHGSHPRPNLTAKDKLEVHLNLA